MQNQGLVHIMIQTITYYVWLLDANKLFCSRLLRFHHYIQCLYTVPQITEKPDLSTHSIVQNSMMYSQKVALQAGDALFIPEGWLHQVDSDEVTIAVNIWWRSSIMTSLPEHMDAYYLRIILRRFKCDIKLQLVLRIPDRRILPG
ncbi:hypothetical protein MKW92_039658 [Papaver armeniacum]|nr:hypothetical protein MKW92_039658 [Papaver armeniacum]